ncbi:hypothetical protein [Spirillospora sp. CA-294931]|uniref:hypothetical protein n=1 Tax=Spirillospora sp. CA-294931 TaxID=3240042 RepID=UPI003D9201F9
MKLDCLSCTREFSAPDFLACCQGYQPGPDAMGWVCSHCGGRVEVRVVTGEVQRGYVYGAGTAHFSNEHRLPVPGLTGERDGDAFVIRLDGRMWRVER